VVPFDGEDEEAAIMASMSREMSTHAGDTPRPPNGACADGRKTEPGLFLVDGIRVAATAAADLYRPNVDYFLCPEMVGCAELA